MKGALFVSLALWACAATAPCMADEANDLASHDLVLLAPLRPVRVRLVVWVDGEPYRARWRAHAAAVAADLDTDGDGRLTTEQVVLLSRLAGDGEPSQNVGTQAMGDTVPVDSAITSLEEIAPPLAARSLPGRLALAPGMFSILDANGDGQLTNAELTDAPARLAKRDFDDDGTLTADELAAAPIARGQVAREEGSDSARVGVVVLLRNPVDAAGAANAILAHYDHDGDGRLACQGIGAEVSLTADVLEFLSANSAEGLGRDELARFCAGPADVEIPIALGKPRRGEEPEANMPAGMRGKRRIDGGFFLDTLDARVEIHRNNRDPAQNPEQEVPFSAFDADGNEYLDENELAAAGFGVTFALVDSDRDQMVRREEFEAYVDRQNRKRSTRLILDVVDQGQELFVLADADQDGRLTPREQQSLVNLLKTADRDNDGNLGSHEVPLQVKMQVGRGSLSQASAVVRARATRTRRVARRPAGDAPEWFAKMDRNEDGDLSRREFLARSETFDRLDVNDDGFIDRREAEAEGR